MSQETKVIVQLREMILSGEMPGGERILEVALAQKLGTSRTPVRYALSVLAAEGLITGGGKRGFSVRSFTIQDIADAIDVRGALEGLAARRAAENGVSAHAATEFRSCLVSGDALLSRGRIELGDDEAYEQINRRFHELIVQEAKSEQITNALSLNDRLPFAAAGAVALEQAPALSKTQYDLLFAAHAQHHVIVEALESRQAWRLQALMQEHALIAKKNITMVASGRNGTIDPTMPVTPAMMQELRLTSLV